jgi:hypothetical protein
VHILGQFFETVVDVVFELEPDYGQIQTLGVRRLAYEPARRCVLQILAYEQLFQLVHYLEGRKAPFGSRGKRVFSDPLGVP